MTPHRHAIPSHLIQLPILAPPGDSSHLVKELLPVLPAPLLLLPLPSHQQLNLLLYLLVHLLSNSEESKLLTASILTQSESIM